MLEVGFNTRHFSAAEHNVAFRTMETMDPSLEPSDALSISWRFIGKTLYDTYVGVEGETGAIVHMPGSNLAGAYGVAGIRQSLGRTRISAELVAGRRWVRYALDGARSDPAKWISEPRLHADLWLGDQVTFGGAIGATYGERLVWIAGVYIGLHSHPLDTRGLE
jgi:hypothetical protein